MRQIEIVGGGFYEPILVVIPSEDCFEQITRLSDYVEKHFGRRPKGAWLAERVWEPQLPSSLAAAGVEYTLVDDNHFLGAGFELDQLFGYFTAEDQCRSVKVLPGLKALRYLIPFRGAEETSQFLRRAAAEHPGSFAAMGDDMEKFGVWPGTYDHCYRDHWLENFFTDLERNSDWLETSTPIDAVSFARFIGTRRSSHRFLHRDDGMVSAHPGAEPLPRFDCGICQSSCGIAFLARRNLEKFLFEVLRIELAAQKNAARFGQGSPSGANQPSKQILSSGSRGSQDSRAAKPMQ